MNHIWEYNNMYQFDKRLCDGMPPLIISVAITGGVVGKEANPNLPETPEEQAQSVYKAYNAGASTVHIHARDPKTGYAYSSTNAEDYLEVNRRVRELCPDIIINNTTGGGTGNLSSADRMKSLDARPEVASLNCGPLIIKAKLPKRKPPLAGRDETVSLDNFIIPITPGEIESFAKAMMERNIKPELEVYSTNHLNFANILIEQKLIRPPYWFSLIFSNPYGGVAQAANLKSIALMMDSLPENSMFQIIGVGYAQLFVNTISIVTGSHVRVGMEDNIFYKRGQLLDSNAQAVERIVRLSKELGREVATPAQAREMLNISGVPSQY